jgi:integrase
MPWDAGLVVKRKLRPFLRSLEIREAGLHAFRHGIASLMDRPGVPLKVRQQRGGWSDARFVLQTYTHEDVEAQRPLAEQLGQILNRDEPKYEEEGVAPFEQPQLVH